MSRRIIKVAVALLLLTLTFYAVNFSDLTAALQQITAEMAIALLLLSAVMIYLSALKWRIVLLGLAESDAERKDLVSTARLFNLYLVGYFVNLVFPSYVGGDIVRSVHLGRRVGQVRALAATVFERYTGLLAMVLLAFVFVWFADGVTVRIQVLVSGLALALVVGTIMALRPPPAALFNLLPYRIRSALQSPLLKLQSSFHLVRRNQQVVISSMVLSFVFHCLTVLNTALAGAAVGWTDPSILKLFVVVPIILLVGALPVSPQGLGIQEGAFYYFLQIAGASPAQALGVALVLRAKSYVLALGGGVVWLWDRRSAAASQGSDAS